MDCQMPEMDISKPVQLHIVAALLGPVADGF
jgi:hypothetical protein